ncbi:hypothetical protein [Rhodococcus olei]|uniref:hypothetical protein n=1 Tax=Rhodococcus olei TaxID=2161675 RepID=UPI0031EEABF9
MDFDAVDEVEVKPESIVVEVEALFCWWSIVPSRHLSRYPSGRNAAHWISLSSFVGELAGPVIFFSGVYEPVEVTTLA